MRGGAFSFFRKIGSEVDVPSPSISLLYHIRAIQIQRILDILEVRLWATADVAARLQELPEKTS